MVPYGCFATLGAASMEAAPSTLPLPNMLFLVAALERTPVLIAEYNLHTNGRLAGLHSALPMAPAVRLYLLLMAVPGGNVRALGSAALPMTLTGALELKAVCLGALVLLAELGG